MKKFLIVVLGIFLVSAVSAESATFQTDETQTVNIGGSPVTLELTGVNQDDEHSELYSATFVDSDGMTITVNSWNAHEYDYTGSMINDEEVGLMNWDGADTDTNTDDTATLTWGREYFQCEGYSTEENEIKFCDESEKTLDINDEETSLEFQYVRTDDEHELLKHAAFLNSEGQTLTLSSENAPEYQHTLSSINGRTAYLTETRGSNTERGSDDAVLIELRESEMFDVEILVNERNGRTIEFRTNAESSLGIQTVEWDFDNDNQYEAEGRTVEKTFDEGGEKTVNLRVEDAEQSQTASKTVQVEEESEYSLRDYSPGDKATLSQGEGLLFNDQTYYFDEISGGWVYGWANEVIEEEDATQEEINRHRSGVAEGGSTVQTFGQTDYAIAACEVSESQATVVLKQSEQVTDSWPESHCEETETDYEVREVEKISNYLGGNIDDVGAGTHIKFGNDLQNSLYINSLDGERIRQVQIEASAGSEDGETFNLNWDNMVQGVRKQFNSGGYSVHLCGDSDPSNGKVTVSIAKQEGTNGYGTCFNDEKQGMEEQEYTERDYGLGEKVNVSEGEKLVFGQNILYVDNYTYAENIDRYTVEAYANKLVNNNELRPVSGTSTDGYFYTGRYDLNFCNYYEGQEKGELVIAENGNACNEGSDEESDSSGEVVQEIDLTGESWNNIAININEVSLSDSKGNCELQPYEVEDLSGYAWTVQDESWKALSRDQELSTTKGYSVYASNDCTLEFEGERASVTQTRQLSGGMWNLVTLPPDSSPSDLQDAVQGRGETLLEWENELFWTNTGEEWIHPQNELSNIRSVYVYPSETMTISITSVEEGPGVE